MRNVVGVFAHPDDEALGPSGTIAKLSRENSIFLICVTNGDNAHGKPDAKLAQTRRNELLSSAKVLGVKEVFFLDFADGTLSNNNYHQVAVKIKEKLDIFKPEIIITEEPRGVSGHLDHIAVSMICSFIFEKTKYVKEIWYHCISETMRRLIPPYFIYFPPGYKKEEIDKIIDVSKVWPQKRKAMLCHKSQIKDALMMIGIETILPKEEYFLVRKK